MPILKTNYPIKARFGHKDYIEDVEVDEERSYFPSVLSIGWYNYADSQCGAPG